VVAFEILGAITDVQTIAVGRQIRELSALVRLYGLARWRKRKGFARVRLSDGTVRLAELHWYEAHGIGKKKLKLKKIVWNE
jgi:hypothetical protein